MVTKSTYLFFVVVSVFWVLTKVLLIPKLEKSSMLSSTSFIVLATTYNSVIHL